MENILISIIVPAYNIENYIGRCLESILQQTYNNLEVIVVDDGSTDKTGNLIDQYAVTDQRIIPVHKKNGGVTSARILGIEKASGIYIGFVDGDDYIEPGMYELLLKNALKYNAQISHCGYQMVFPGRTDFYYGTGRVVEQDNEKGLLDLLEGKFVEPGLWNKLFHKSLFYNLMNEKKMDVSIKNTEDLLMNYYLFYETKKSVFVDECLYHYMIRKGSIATSKINENKLRDPLKVLKILEKETEENPKVQLVVKKRIVSQLISVATLRSNKSKKMVNDYRKKARKELRKLLPKILAENYSLKQKAMSIWVSLWPSSYSWSHRVYEKITGIDKKYEVN